MAWTGHKDSGSREYTDVEAHRVIRAFLEMSDPVGMEKFTSSQPGIEPRAVRAILADYDGVQYVVAEGPDGIYPASTFEEAEPKTRTLNAAARSMADRVERRRSYAERLVRIQPTLLEPSDAGGVVN